MINFYTSFWKCKDEAGSNGDFKVQLYDLEADGNSLMSYDFELWKIDPLKTKKEIQKLVQSNK